MKGRCLNRLTTRPSTPRAGLEPATTRLTAECSTIELSRKVERFAPSKLHIIKQHFLEPFWSSPRPISNSQLRTLLPFHPCPIYLVVFKGSYFFRMRDLILRGASRLDAFSVYPFQTWLLCRAPGGATDTPVVRPSRSSRTKDSSSQISYARAG